MHNGGGTLATRYPVFYCALLRLRGNICETLPVPVLIACIDTRKFATSFGFGLSANTGGGRRIIAGLIAGQKRAQRSNLYQYGRKYF